MVAIIRLTRDIIAGQGCRKTEYRCGDLVLTGLAHATVWCLRGWAEPADSPKVVASPAAPALVECFPCEVLAASS
jgi:hypothetical protein